MTKRAIRIPPLRAGRRVRLTFEVSADVDGKGGTRTKKSLGKRRRARAIVTNKRDAAAHRKTPVSATTTAPRVTPAATTTMSRDEAGASVVRSLVTHPPATVRRRIRPQMIALAIIALLVAATLALPRRPAPVAAAVDGQTERLHQSSDVALVAQPVALPSAPPAARGAVASVAAPRTISESSAKAAVSKPEKNRIAEAAAPVATVTPSTEALGTEGSTTARAASESINAEPTPVSADPVGSGAVTLAGCLETSASKDQFRLTDTKGVDAPRSRSWRTGFLKKRTTTVALVAPPDPRALQTQVGQRVAATGLLTNRELRVTSVRVLGARCD
jgi:hypothetical protein